jgi:hypothetical protein
MPRRFRSEVGFKASASYCEKQLRTGIAGIIHFFPWMVGTAPSFSCWLICVLVGCSKEIDMIELTELQGQAIAGQENPTILDPRTQATYVLVRQEIFARIEGLFYDDFELSHDELRLLLARSAKSNGWDEPGMEAYDSYDEALA